MANGVPPASQTHFRALGRVGGEQIGIIPCVHSSSNVFPMGNPTVNFEKSWTGERKN
jgi:hypothetical protein